MKILALYLRHKKWLLPALVGIVVFAVSQIIIDYGGVFGGNPLPSATSWGVAALRPASAFVGDIVSDTPLDAELTIDRLGITVPIVWSTSTKEADLQKDLEHGALRYPGTPDPGSIGNSFITAHSSDYPWKNGMYKKVFSKLGKLKEGDDDIVVVYKKDGVPVHQVRFKVTFTKIVQATDMRMIEQGDAREITLVTCWPVGTSLLRFMVRAEAVSAGAM